MSSVIDLEAQQVAQAALRAGQDINHEAQSVIPQVEGSGGSDISEINIDQSHRSDDVNDRPSQADSEAPIPAASNSTVDTSSRDTTSDPESDQQPEEQPEEPRMIGDFDGSANEFWKLYRDEAKSHDDARIDTLKEGMDSALIFAGLFSAALTAFVVDSKQNLTPSPADRSVVGGNTLLRGIVLPPTTLYHPLSDFRATILNCPTGYHSFHPATSFPTIQSIDI